MKTEQNIPQAYAANAAYANILSRVSVRRYADKPIAKTQIDALLHAAMSAPTAVNRQPWEFVVVDSPDLLMALADALPYAKMAAQAPAAIVVCANMHRFLDGVDSSLWEQDLSAASENILLAAHAIGLGAVWTCLYPHDDRMEAARKILDIPADIVPFNLLPVGYPETERPPMDKWHPERVHYNRFSISDDAGDRGDTPVQPGLDSCAG